MSIRLRVLAALVGGVAASFAALAPAATAATPTPSSTAPSATAAACDEQPWEAMVQGRPDFHPGGLSGDYLWHDRSGFHLRVTHRGKEQIVYSGQLLASAPMRIEPVKLEGRDYVALSADHRYLTFRFYNYGRTDGVDFHTDCASRLQVRWLDANGHPVWHERVYLGAKSQHPQHVPFLVHRMRAA